MVKETPSLLRLGAMVLFTLSCVGILMFLWLAFGGPLPLKAEGYRMKVAFGEAATLAVEADVRIAGVNVGKVKTKELDKGGNATLAELEIEEEFAPVPRDSRAILRQKTLLGETYVELSTGDRSGPALADGGRLADVFVQPTVELDEIFNAFDKPTRTAFQGWVKELAKAAKGGRGEDLNDAFGNLEPFAVDGAQLLSKLDEQDVAVRRLIKNTGVVFGALNRREGALRDVIVNSNEAFEATASRDDALAETFRVFPTFLDESRSTLVRLERFSNDTRPLVNILKGPATDLGPTVRDLGDLAPDLEGLFRELDPLIRASRTGLPDLERFLAAGEPVFESAHAFFPELNPVLSLFSFHQATVAGFISNGGSNIAGNFGSGNRVQAQIGQINGNSFARFPTRPRRERGNAYLAPNALNRGLPQGPFVESFDCRPSGGEQPDPDDQVNNPNPLTKSSAKSPPCLVQPKSLWSGNQFNSPRRGQAPQVDAPEGTEGSAPIRRR